MKRKSTFMLCALTVVMAIIARCWQLFTMTEQETGFINKNYTVIGAAVTVFILVCIACMGLIASEHKTVAIKEDCNISHLIVSVVAAAAIIYEIIDCKYYQSMSVPLRALTALVAVVTAIVIVFFSMNKTIGTPFANPLLSVLTAYGFIRLILSFMSTSKIVTINDNIYELGFLCASLLFWLYLGQSQNFSDGRTALRMRIFGVVGFGFGMVSALPKLAAVAASRSELVYNGTTSFVTDIVISIYIIWTVYGVEK